MKLDKQDIIGVYNKLKNRAIKAYELRNYDKCLKYIEISAYIAFRFSWIYKDDVLESLIIGMSKLLLKPVENYMPSVNRYVFYDSFSYDNRGLTQQYIRTLISQGVDFMYITESSKRNNYSNQIFSEITEYKKAEIFEISQDVSRKDRIGIIYQQITSYNPSRLLMHLSPNAVCPLVAMYALPQGITKYQINLTDHAYWLGAGCLDYSLEFRPYGCSISITERRIDEKKVLLLPYYPITTETMFQGFPKECDGKVIIFSGGAYPKILGDNNRFMDLVKQMLLANSEAIFLYAGSGDSIQIDKFITDNGLEKRFLLLGHRSDINEVFRHCDIYMSTYPLGGGLMAQFAAINGKPIISYSTIDKISSWPEETICQLKKMNITRINIDDFLTEAHQLVSNPNYRITYGETLKECVISEDKFIRTYEQTIRNNVNRIPYELQDVNVNNIFMQNIDIENVNNEFKIYLLKSLKLGTLKVSPKILFWAFSYLFSDNFRIKAIRRLNIR
jgi:hypothetical protein